MAGVAPTPRPLGCGALGAVPPPTDGVGIDTPMSAPGSPLEGRVERREKCAVSCGGSVGGPCPWA